MRKLVLCAMFAVLPLLAASSDSWSQDDPPQAVKAAPDKDHMDSSNGSFAQSIAIEVPTFRGLEPSLSLDYDSGRGNGFLGVGWRLRGLSSVERSSPRFGIPRYDDALDVFLLDGDELIACSALANPAVSPGCAAGGTHATRFESYLRINRDTANNRWEVTNREGTRLTYYAVSTWGTYNTADPDAVKRATNYRWLLASITDVHNNAVQYSYSCDGVPDCYIDTIAYNGNSIRLYRDTRVDLISYATGAGLGQVRYRLKTIEVRTGTQLVRAYALSYSVGTSTQRSRISSVQEAGRDATVDQTTGAVSGGTLLPPSGFTYSEGTNAFSLQTWGNGVGEGAGSKQFVGDFNGDGRNDLAIGSAPGAGCTIPVHLSSGTSFSRVAWSVAGCSGRSDGYGVDYVADVNGDGKSDLVMAQTQAKALVSTGSSFQLSNLQASMPNTKVWLAADLNGDGLTDFAENQVVYAAGICTVAVRLSTGSSYTEASWPVTGCTAGLGNLRTGDLNGDGRADLIFIWSGLTLERIFLYTYLSTGTGFKYAEWQRPPGTTSPLTYAALLGDVNGDGTADVVHVLPTVVRVFSFQAGNFVEQTWASGLTLSQTSVYQIGDVSGDGRDDVVMLNQGDTKVLVSRGSSYQLQTWATHPYAVPTDGFVISDFTGDGKSDAVRAKGVVGNTTLITPGAFPDLLTGITNSLGGATTVTYTASSNYANSNLPFVTQTVSSISANDGRGTASTTDYIYAGGSWNAAERRFLGFQKVTATLPANAGETQRPKVETTYKQTLACAGAVQTVKQMDGAGTVLRQTDEVYADNSATLPYTCLNTETTSTVNDGASSKSAKVSRTFDAYANVVTLTRHGNLAVSGDETISEAVYQPNTAAYIVSLPSRLRVHAGTSTAGAKLQESYIYYDGAAASTTPPVKGDATQTQAWLNTTGGFVTSSATYDPAGNLKTQTDPLGNVTSIFYDPTYNLFPVEVRDPLYPNDNRHKITTAWDYVCGLPTQVTDMNGLVTETKYDALCRPRIVKTPSGAFACTNYLNLGSPTTQHIETQTVPPAPEGTTSCDLNNPATFAFDFTAGANLWSRTYLDGFGRGYRSASEGPGGAQTAIESLTAYNERGAVKSATAPFYVNGATPDPQFATTWKYDILDRKIEKRHPDNKFVQGSYGLSTLAAGFEKAVVIDERGTATAANDRIATVHTDVFGRTIRTDRLADPVTGTTVSTNYQYDLLDRLVGLTDHAGNQWSYTYDSLGRRTQVVDPDLGTWNYVYDAGGRLTDQTDAKGQVTRLTYDALGRVLTKTARFGTAQADTTTYTYDQARTGFFNVGRQTTASNAAATIVYNFDNEGRQVAQTYTLPGVTPSTYSFTTAYDTGGRPLRQTYPDGDSVGSLATPLAYDAAGRLKTVPDLVSNIIYDARGNQTNVTRPNGVSTVMGWSAQRGWLNSLVTSGTKGTVQDLTYTRDEVGRITGVASPLAGDGWAYGYDDLDRLLSADNTTDNTLDQSFTYDLVGNMLTNSKVGTYAYPAQGAGSVRPHAVTGISGGPLGSQAFTYDANGSMTLQGLDTHTYDGENRLVSAVDGATTTQFVYGPDGARLKKVAGGVTTLYFGDDVEVIPGATPQYTKYLPGDAKRVDFGAITWLHRDHLQSVRALTSAAGAILDRANYRPFGEQQGFATVTESKGYIGQRHDDETGLMYLHARYYDPVLGRFVQADPMDPYVPGVGVNRYAYAFNNPVMMLDPSGLGANGNQTPDSFDGNDTKPANGAVVDREHQCGCNDHAHGGAFFARYDFSGALLTGTAVNQYGIATGLKYYDSYYSFSGGLVATRLSGAWRVYDATTWFAITGQVVVAGPPTRPTGNSNYPGFESVAAYLDNPDYAAMLYTKLMNDVPFTSLELNLINVADLVPYAERIYRVLAPDRIALEMRVVAIMVTREGAVLVAAGGAQLTAAQVELAESFGMRAVPGQYVQDPTSGRTRLEHAEITLVNEAASSGLSPVGIAVSQQVCSKCVDQLTGAGAFVSGQVAAWP